MTSLNAIRVERPFWWPGQRGDGNAPPAIIAVAVARQDEWDNIELDWPKISLKLKAVQPEGDWSRPVWYDAALLEKYDAAEKAMLDAAVQQVCDEQERQAASEAEAAARWFARNGIAALMERLHHPIRYEADPEYHPGYHTSGTARLEVLRATALAELRPHAKRVMVKPVTIREALVASLVPIDKRTTYKTNRRIEKKSAGSVRKNLCGIFGLSSNEKMEVVRDTGIDVEWPLQNLDRVQALVLADFWHEMPDGVESIRTVRNYLHGGRRFFRFCQNQEDYGWKTPPDILDEYTASKVDTPAMPYDPAQIKRILARGGDRLKMYCAFGLTCGYYQMDCTRIRDAEYYLEALNRFIKRLRSKESKPKQGRLPIAVRHWITPELVTLIDAERGTNSEGVLFNSERGTALTVPAVAGVWRRACEDSGEHLPFKQLRKIGFNAIKRLSKSVEVADLWAGHSLGTNDAYDDGIFEPVNDAERLWCEELRRDGIL